MQAFRKGLLRLRQKRARAGLMSGGGSCFFSLACCSFLFSAIMAAASAASSGVISEMGIWGASWLMVGPEWASHRERTGAYRRGALRPGAGAQSEPGAGTSPGSATPMLLAYFAPEGTAVRADSKEHCPRHITTSVVSKKLPTCRRIITFVLVWIRIHMRYT